jgi:hypothetical protein
MPTPSRHSNRLFYNDGVVFITSSTFQLVTVQLSNKNQLVIERSNDGDILLFSAPACPLSAFWIPGWQPAFQLCLAVWSFGWVCDWLNGRHCLSARRWLVDWTHEWQIRRIVRVTSDYFLIDWLNSERLILFKCPTVSDYLPDLSLPDTHDVW